MKILAVYPGRFQPFHKGHAQVYQWLKNKFGDAVIATSDKVEAPKSPFNFAEKKRMMMLAGVPSSDIQQVTNPYIAREILRQYDPKTTVLVFAVSQKDMEEDPRFSFKPTKTGKPGYLQPYKGNEKKLKPFGDTMMPKGYVIVTPTFTFDVLGKPATSASELRKQFVSLNDEKQKAFIKDLFGKYNASVHKLMNDKIGAMLKKPKTVKQLKESLNIGLTFARKEMPQIGAASSFMKYLRDNEIGSKREKVDPSELRSSQMEFDRDKVDSIRMNPSKNPIIVSNDGHVMDGHHRWLADKEENRECDAIVCDLPILDLLYHAKNYSQQLKEEVTRKELAPMLDTFVSFASDKLGLKSMPSIRYKTDDDDYNSFAAYNPSSNELSISTINRHPMDIFRSVAHELVHHKQNEDGRLGKDIAKEGETGSDIENEANAEAGKIMRWFAKANPDMFGRSYVVESTNTAAMAPVGGIRGLGNVTGEVSPTVTSQYVIHNQTETQKMQGNQLAGLWYDDGIDSFWLDAKGKNDYQKKAMKSFKNLRENLNEGINDPGKLKAIFLAGGPGSGKEYVMNATLAGEGLKEINSDVAFEYLMQKNGLDLEMPDEERVERDIVRGRAKNITKEQERLALSGRLGLIINGTADDLEKIKTIKSQLEADGYETMMVFVNTSNEVSRERNVERGKMGKRKVPDGTDKQGNPDNSPNIRQEKWDLAQKNIGELQKIFGNERFAVLDNTADIRKVGPEEKEKVLVNFNRVRRMAQQFVRADNKNPAAAKWIEREAEKRGITYQEPKRNKTLTQIRQDVPKVVHKPDNDLMLQARRLGLSYYGFGRFGRKVGGVNKVLFHSKGGKLMRVQTVNEDLRQWFSKTHPKGNWKRVDTKGNIKGDCAREPGEGKPKCMPASKAYSMSKEDRAKSAKRKRREDPVADRSGKGNKPVMVKTESVQKAIDKINRDRMSEEILSEKNQPTNPSLWSKAKSLARSKFDVYPSAYANGWAAKWYKSKGGGWKSVNEEKGTCWDGYVQKGMKKKGNRMVPNCVPANEAFEQFLETNGNKPDKKKKKLSQEAMDASVQGGYAFGADGIGPTFAVPRAGTPYGFGYGSAYSAGLSESIVSWMQSERTQQKFATKYGDLWEDKLVEAALRLEEAGCGCSHSEKKSIKKLREGMEGGVNNMSMIPTQRKNDDVNEKTLTPAEMSKREDIVMALKRKGMSKDKAFPIATARAKQVAEEQLNERGADSKGLYRPTEKGAGLTRKGAKHYGVKTAVTTPPSKLDPKGKAAKRRKSFCARMGGMKGPMKDEKGRPTRKAMSLRRWNCEE
jgi:cytidyltransferase-like protein